MSNHKSKATIFSQNVAYAVQNSNRKCSLLFQRERGQRLSAIEEALEEAHYFYSKMQETAKIPKEFRHNLNAFLSRARAITWVLKKQYLGNPVFDSWYANEEKLLKSDELMSFFRDARNISLKEQPIRPRSSTYIRHIEITTPKGKGFAITGNGEPVWIEKNGQGKEKRTHAGEFDSEVAREYYFENPQPPKLFRILQVIDLCGLYLEALRRLVEEALKVVSAK
jgi:hypothetical protein